MVNENYVVKEDSVKAEKMSKHEFVDRLMNFLNSFSLKSDMFCELMELAIGADEILRKDDYTKIHENTAEIYPIPVSWNEQYQSIFEVPHLKAAERARMEEYIGSTMRGIPYINVWCSAYDCLGAVVTIYWDGSHFRMYTPVRGNYINTVYHCPIMMEKNKDSDLFEELYKEAEKVKDFYKPLMDRETARKVTPGYLYLYAQKIVFRNIDAFDAIMFEKFDPVTGTLWYKKNNVEILLEENQFDSVPINFNAIHQEIDQIMY